MNKFNQHGFIETTRKAQGAESSREKLKEMGYKRLGTINLPESNVEVWKIQDEFRTTICRLTVLL